MSAVACAASHSADTQIPQFLFRSDHLSIRAAGIFQTITQPATGGEHASSQFQQAVSRALDQAVKAGLSDPIVMGAIPFDTRQPSCLYIPQEYEFFLPQDSTDYIKGDDPVVLSTDSQPTEQDFKAGVRQVLDVFRHGNISKAVLSRIIDLHLAEPIAVEHIMAGLQAKNANGYHFRIPLADQTDLIGVSPELLVRKVGGQVYSNPLAGSAKRQSDTKKDNAAAQELLQSGKDHYEHRLVIDDIRRLLSPYCTKLDIPTQPSLLSTASMWHLSTAINGQLMALAPSALQLACQLHPTPAVCGFPTRQARDLIHQIEPFDRELFAGTVGWCDAHGDGEWAVTIRCGMVRRNLIRLFAGAGIVAGSDPDAEWAEIRAKLGTMLAAFGCDASTLLMNSIPTRPDSAVRT